MISIKNSKIIITGGRGFLGRQVIEAFVKAGASRKKIIQLGRKDYDLRKFSDCKKAVTGADLVVHLAANFDGLKYNTEHAAEVFYDNAVMGINLVKASYEEGIKKFILAGTVGSYPKTAPIPYKEEDYWNGLPEAGNDSYGLSKKMVDAALRAFSQQYGFKGFNLILANMYGPGDHFSLDRANVIPALVHKFLKAKRENIKEVVMWGSGKATREFLFVEDAARAVVLSALNYEGTEPLNIGSGEETPIRKIAEQISLLVGFKGKIVWDKTKPEGQRRRVMDVSKARKLFGFKAKVNFAQGLKRTIAWYKANEEIINKK